MIHLPVAGRGQNEARQIKGFGRFRGVESILAEKYPGRCPGELRSSGITSLLKQPGCFNGKDLSPDSSFDFFPFDRCYLISGGVMFPDFFPAH